MGKNDEELVRDYNTGNREAFEIVFREHYSTLRFFANKFVEDPDCSEDIVQDVFLWLYEKRPRFDDLVSLRSYLYRSVHNKCLNWLKKNDKQLPLDKKVKLSSGHDDLLFETAQLESETFEAIFRAVGELPPQCGEVFRLSYIERHDVKTVAGKLNISENTVKVHRQRAKKILKDKLKNLYTLLSFMFF